MPWKSSRSPLRGFGFVDGHDSQLREPMNGLAATREAKQVSNGGQQTDTKRAWKPPFMPWFESDFAGSFNVRKMCPLARLMYRSLLQQGWHSDNPPYLPNDDATLRLMADAIFRSLG